MFNNELIFFFFVFYIDVEVNTIQALVNEGMEPLFEQLIQQSAHPSPAEGFELSAESLINELTLPGTISRQNLELLCQPQSHSFQFTQNEFNVKTSFPLEAFYDYFV